LFVSFSLSGGVAFVEDDLTTPFSLKTLFLHAMDETWSHAERQLDFPVNVIHGEVSDVKVDLLLFVCLLVFLLRFYYFSTILCPTF
jgi:hypothetical protein